MWPFLSKVFEASNGGWGLLLCFIVLVAAIEHIIVVIIKRVKTPKEK
jgi:hypothetical protein